jgi:hypothetical protein
MGLGRGRGRRGGGRGWRHWYHATGLPRWARYGYAPAYGPYPQPLPEEEEAELLKNQAEALKQELDAIARRLEELGREG